jgi:hypothetical protein
MSERAAAHLVDSVLPRVPSDRLTLVSVSY